MYALVTEQMMDVEEIITAGTNQNNTENFVILGMKDEEDGLLQLKQCIASDLISLLLCVAQVSSSSSAGIKSCAKNCDGILENIIDRVSYDVTFKILCVVFVVAEDDYN